MNGKDFNEVVALIVHEDPRFDRGAYFFVRQGLKATMDKLAGKDSTHVNGRQLSEGLRDHALEQFGPMSFTMLQTWGLRTTEDFGHIVFNLVDHGIFGKTEQDSIEDFRNVFDFDQAFIQPFRPKRLQILAGPN